MMCPMYIADRSHRCIEEMAILLRSSPSRCQIFSKRFSWQEFVNHRRETQVARLTQSAQDQYEMNVRAANIVRAGESLMKLVSDMKEFLILNDFPSVNTSISERSNALQEINNVTDQQLLTLKQELAVNLFDLEQSYFSSSFR